MSIEQNPTYHYQKHLEVYDVWAPRESSGEIGIVMDKLDQLLYAGEGTVIQPHSARANSELFESHFSYEYYRGENTFLGLAWPLESIGINVDHTRHLGRAALLQSYKIRVDSSIHQASVGQNRVTTMYYLEEFAGCGQKYSGIMIRPNIIGDPEQTDEPMTVYDCDQLYTLFDQVTDTINLDKRDRALSL